MAACIISVFSGIWIVCIETLLYGRFYVQKPKKYRRTYRFSGNFILYLLELGTKNCRIFSLFNREKTPRSQYGDLRQKKLLEVCSGVNQHHNSKVMLDSDLRPKIRILQNVEIQLANPTYLHSTSHSRAFWTHCTSYFVTSWFFLFWLIVFNVCKKKNKKIGW